MLPKQAFGAPFKSTAVSTASAATCTVAGVSGQIHYITDISASSDVDAAVVQVKDGATVIWQYFLEVPSAGTNTIDHAFATPLQGSVGAAVIITVNGGLAGGCTSNIAGFTV